MLVLIDRVTGEIIEKHENKNLKDFLENEWGGMFPYKLDNVLHFGYGQILDCEHYDKYWCELEGEF